MTDKIIKYFSNDPEEGSFNKPASGQDIADLEDYLEQALPKDYCDFLTDSNGYEGMIGESYVKLLGTEEVKEYTDGYGGDHYSWIICIGTDGGGEMFVLDKRNAALTYGMLPFVGEDADFIPLGNTFEEFIRHLHQRDFE